MSESLTRAEKALKAVSDRQGGCKACKCERYEPAGVMDGFAMCDCQHTQWSHAKVG